MPEEEEEKGRLTAEDVAKLLKLLGLGLRHCRGGSPMIEVYALASPNAVVCEKTRGFGYPDSWTCDEDHVPKFLLEEVQTFMWSPKWHSDCDPTKRTVVNPFYGCKSLEECMLKWALESGSAEDEKEEGEKSNGSRE